MAVEGQKFGEDWFTRFNLMWNVVLNEFKPLRYLEIGSYEGRSTCYMIDRCSKYGPMNIYCVDTWMGGPEHHGRDFVDVEALFDNNTALEISKAENPVTLHKRKGFSYVELSKLIAEDVEKFDMVYVDGSHKAVDALLDGVLSFKLLKVGGVLIFDDFLAEHTEEQKFDYPRIGIESFLEVHANKLNNINFRVDPPNEITDAEGNIPPSKLYQVYLKKVDE